MGTKGIKILVLLDQMETGGAARVTSTLLTGLVEKEYEVVLAMDNVNCQVFYHVPDAVRQICLPLKNNDRPVIKQLCLIWKTRKIIKEEKPDVIIAVTFFPFFYAHFAAVGLNIPVICYDHTSFGRDMGHFVNWIRYSLYRRADKLVILTKKDESLLGKKFPRREVVYNPLTYPIEKKHTKRDKTILCAGRLDAWRIKGIDRMISIWANLSEKYPEWKLQIAGGGSPSKVDEIRQLIADAGVESSTELLGQVSDMQSLYARTAIFALPSRVEGFPMVLLEAMSQGCVCVSYEMDGAVYEMMSKDSGIIVKDGDQKRFSAALEWLINAFPNLSDRQLSGYSDAYRFGCEEFYNHWDRIIQQTINKTK